MATQQTANSPGAAGNVEQDLQQGIGAKAAAAGAGSLDDVAFRILDTDTARQLGEALTHELVTIADWQRILGDTNAQLTAQVYAQFGKTAYEVCTQFLRSGHVPVNMSMKGEGAQGGIVGPNGETYSGATG